MLNEFNHFLPEDRYNNTILDDGWELNPDAYLGTIVHVFPENFTTSKTLTVKGENFPGFIPENELSIYPIDYFVGSTIPKFLPTVMKSCRVTAIIIGYENGRFVLSRKKSMEQALQNIAYNQIIMCSKVATTYGSAFVDIGGGINAIIPSHEISNCIIESATNYFKDLHYFPCLILEESHTYKNKFVVSYKKVAPQLDISVGSKIKGKVTGLTNDSTGAYVELSPSQFGILDLGSLTVGYNDCSDLTFFRDYDFIVTKIRLYHVEENAFIRKVYSLALVDY